MSIGWLNVVAFFLPLYSFSLKASTFDTLKSDRAPRKLIDISHQLGVKNKIKVISIIPENFRSVLVVLHGDLRLPDNLKDAINPCRDVKATDNSTLIKLFTEEFIKISDNKFSKLLFDSLNPLAIFKQLLK
jgi:hypothetical protein